MSLLSNVQFFLKKQPFKKLLIIITNKSKIYVTQTFNNERGGTYTDSATPHTRNDQVWVND